LRRKPAHTHIYTEHRIRCLRPSAPLRRRTDYTQKETLSRTHSHTHTRTYRHHAWMNGRPRCTPINSCEMDLCAQSSTSASTCSVAPSSMVVPGVWVCRRYSSTRREKTGHNLLLLAIRVICTPGLFCKRRTGVSAPVPSSLTLTTAADADTRRRRARPPRSLPVSSVAALSVEVAACTTQ